MSILKEQSVYKGKFKDQIFFSIDNDIKFSRFKDSDLLGHFNLSLMLMKWGKLNSLIRLFLLLNTVLLKLLSLSLDSRVNYIKTQHKYAYTQSNYSLVSPALPILRP